MTVEEVRGSLDSTDNGAVKNSTRNCLTVFQNDPKLEGAIRYNILTVSLFRGRLSDMGLDSVLLPVVVADTEIVS